MEGQVIGGRYRLVRLIGKGGMGSVWLAEHTALHNQVAIKLIASDLGKLGQARARFIREAQLAARIKSAHVVQVHDYGVTDDGQPFIAMEYLVGESLRDRLTRLGRLSCADAARVVSHISRALTHAHKAGLVHRDIKPENIFIAVDADDETAKVLDFGVAKAADVLSDSSVDPTRTGAMLGTPFYMSPEQAQGLKTVDYRTDLWALGVVAFECITGQIPFTASALGPLIGKIMAGPVPVPSKVAPDVRISPDIDAWMVRALAKDPAQRFASAREMADAFMIAAGVTASVQPAERTDSDPSALRSTPPQSVTDPLGATQLASDVAQAKTQLAADVEQTRTQPAAEVAPAATIVAVPALSTPAPASRLPWIIAVVVLSAVVVLLAVLLVLRR
jgi:serine/threonine-protein kinase